MPHGLSRKTLFIGTDRMTTVMRLFYCLTFPRLRASGKDKTMSIPKTPVEFDYDLWTTEEGKCMVRIKATGEITEVERSVMQVLRSEEKRVRRILSSEQDQSREGKTVPGTPLYYGGSLCWRKCFCKPFMIMRQKPSG